MNALRWLEETEFANWVLTSFVGFPLMLSLHAVGMAIAVGLILVMNLRLLGLFEFVSFRFLRRALVAAWVGLVVNFLSGTALFIPRGVEYVGDPAFLTKIVLILIGVSATAALHARLERESVGWQAGGTVPLNTRLWATASLVIWFGAIASGRLIAYVS
ncbi:MAG: DUF2214 domain-containing protein [Gammaproteobacteria bacterium]